MSLLKNTREEPNTTRKPTTTQTAHNYHMKQNLSKANTLESLHHSKKSTNDGFSFDCQSIKLQESFITQASHNPGEGLIQENKLELFTDNYIPGSEKTIALSSDTKKLEESRILKNLGSCEIVRNFEDVLNTPEAAVAVPKKKPRDVQFYFFINPKAGSGQG